MPQSTIYRRPNDELQADNSPAQAPYPQARMATGEEMRSSGIGQPSRLQRVHANASEPLQNAQARGQQRRDTAGGFIGSVAAGVTNMYDYGQATLRGLGRGVAGGVFELADQIAQGLSTTDQGLRGRTPSSPAGNSPAPAGNSPAPTNNPGGSFWWNGGGDSGLGRAANPAPAGGQPQMGPAAPNRQTFTANDGSTLSAITNYGDNAAARQGLFNAIDQRTADSRASMMGAMQREQIGQNRRGAPDPLMERLGAIDERRSALQQQIDRGMNTSRRGERLTVGGLNALRGQMESLDRTEASIIGSMTSGQNSAGSDIAGIQRQMLANQGQLQNTALSGQNQMAGIMARIQDPTNQARAQMIQGEMSRMGINLPQPQMPDPTNMRPAEVAAAQQQFMVQQDIYNSAAMLIAAEGYDIEAAYQDVTETLSNTSGEDPDEMQRLRSIQHLLAQGMMGRAHAGGGDNVTRLAEGGLVGMGDPGMGGAEMAGMDADPASIQQYQQYVQMAQQMNVEPVGFDEFSNMMVQSQAPAQPPMPQMQQGAMASQGVIGMADGGVVPGMEYDFDPGMGDMSAIGQAGPQVDGQMVVDPSPNAPTDSIPAMIDGQQPAALDSGEFVLPADVVMHFGTEKLNKMIAAARAGSATGAAGAQ